MAAYTLDLPLYTLSYTANSCNANLAEASLKVGHMTHRTNRNKE